MISIDDFIKNHTDISTDERTVLFGALKVKGILMMPNDFTYTISPDGVQFSTANKVKFFVSQTSIAKFLRMPFWVITTTAGKPVYHIYGTQLAANRGQMFLQSLMKDPTAIQPAKRIVGEKLLESTADGERYWHYNWKPSSIVKKLSD
jgi:hypothetical protein